MARYSGDDRMEVVTGTHPVTKEPMPVRRRVGARSVTGTPMDLLAGRSTTSGISQLADVDEPDFDDLVLLENDEGCDGSRLSSLTHLLVSGAELPEVTVLLPVGEAPNVDAVVPVMNDQWAKPRGGLWMSPRTGTTESSWTRWCTRNDYLPGDENVMDLWSMTTPEDAIVLKVADALAANEVHAAFNEAATDGISRMYALIDYEGLAAAGVDAIWVTEDAARATSGNVFTSNPVPFNLWDCETVLWLRPPTGARFTRLGNVNLTR